MRVVEGSKSVESTACNHGSSDLNNSSATQVKFKVTKVLKRARIDSDANEIVHEVEKKRIKTEEEDKKVESFNSTKVSKKATTEAQLQKIMPPQKSLIRTISYEPNHSSE